MKAYQIEQDINKMEFNSTLIRLKGKSPFLDRVLYGMIKHSRDVVKSRTLNLYKAIFNSYISHQYKTSLIIPILKPDSDKTLAKSYRSISLNSCIGEVMDRIIANRIW